VAPRGFRCAQTRLLPQARKDHRARESDALVTQRMVSPESLIAFGRGGTVR